MAESRAGSRRMLLEQQREQAVQLRIAGGTLRAIGAQMGVSYEKVRRLVMQALDETRARTAVEVERLREQELRRCDAVILAQWQNRTDPQAARVILAASERRARLLGLDAPVRLEPVVQAEEELPVERLPLDKRRAILAILDEAEAAPASEQTIELPALPPVR